MEAHKPGDKVPASGVYRVIHDGKHSQDHEVTAVIGERFPPCMTCGSHPTFYLVRAAHHIGKHKHFKPPQ